MLEGRVGGRIFERTPEGEEWDWGEVTAWEPPARLVYLWHLKRDRAEATEVEIRFVSLASDATRVDIEHRGWEAPRRRGPDLARSEHGRLGDPAAALSERPFRRPKSKEESA